jgi:hypothetical protein
MSTPFIPFRQPVVARCRHSGMPWDGVVPEGFREIVYLVHPFEEIPFPPYTDWLVKICDAPPYPWCEVGCNGGALGPEGFGNLDRLLMRATAFALYSGVMTPELSMVVLLAVAEGGRVVLVESQPEQLIPWANLLRWAASKAKWFVDTPNAGAT